MIIKSVVTALPNHVMSCFRLPKIVMKKLTSTVAQFWWIPKVILEACTENHGINCVSLRMKENEVLKIS